MKPPLHLIELTQVPIFQQLQWEEALLRVDRRNWCLLNRGSPPAIVLGISGVVDELVCSEKWKCRPIPVVRRFSGGGTVVVDHDTLFVTLICQSDLLPVPPFPRPLMEWSAELYRPLFPDKALFQLQENDYAIGERKWGGNAQAIIKGRWLHHSSLLWKYDLAHMDYLLLPPKMPFYRQKRSHADFLCCLSDYWSDCDLFKMALMGEISRHFRLIHAEREEVERVAELPHRRVTRLET